MAVWQLNLWEGTLLVQETQLKRAAPKLTAAKKRLAATGGCEDDVHRVPPGGDPYRRAVESVPAGQVVRFQKPKAGGWEVCREVV